MSKEQRKLEQKRLRTRKSFSLFYEGKTYPKMNFEEEFWKVGLANKEGLERGDVDPDQLEMGIEVEMEHTTNKDVAERIALDHLAEIPDYYSRLKKMEEEAKNETESSGEST